MINRERMLREFFSMLAIKCSTRDEREIAAFLTTKLAGLGLEVYEDDVAAKVGGTAGNLWAKLPGTVKGAPTILLSAHMDCVEPCANIVPKVENGLITSQGATILGADDKSGIAAILEALQVIKENKLPHGPVQILLTVCEEGGLNGSKLLDPARLAADFGYVLDSSGPAGNIITTAPGQKKIKVVVHGKTAHAGLAPEQGINAIVVASRALARVPQGRIDAETTANIGTIHGGTATNVVPDRVEVLGEARSLDGKKLAAHTDKMVEVLKTEIAANGGRAEITVTTAYEPYALKQGDEVVRLAEAAAARIGLKTTLKSTGGGSDANNFNRYGVPSAVLATGMGKAHTTDEFIKEEDLYKVAELVLAVVQEAARKNG